MGDRERGNLGTDCARTRTRSPIIALCALVLLTALIAADGSPRLPAGGAAGAAIVGSCTPATSWPASSASLSAQLLQLVNNHRASMGRAPLSTSQSLTQAAVWKARHMAAYRYMAHNDPAPPVARSWLDRVHTCGYPMSAAAAENIAAGYRTPTAVVNAWLGSASHRANIENASYKSIGIGAAGTTTTYWAQNFGSSTAGSSAPTSPPPSPPPAPPPPAPPASPPQASPPPPPPLGSVSASAYPASTTIYSGSLVAGDATRLRADDGSLYQVASTTTGTRLTSWYGRVSGVSNALTRLAVAYRGSHSAACTQGIYLWSWSSGYWVRFSSTSGSTSETEASFTLTGSLAGYVSGTTGNGDVAVRVHCTRSDTVAFTTGGDLMRVTFWNP